MTTMTEEEPSQASTIYEVKGGSVLLEQGAIGGFFYGVVFLGVEDDVESVVEAVEDTMAGHGSYIYGGQVFMVGGTLKMVDCIFYESSIMYAFTDQVRIVVVVVTVVVVVVVTALVG